MDVYSRKIVGWQVYAEESAENAADLVEATCRAERVKRDQVILHSDKGSPMKGATLLVTLQRLGVLPSFSRPSVSNDNPYSESLFRTIMKFMDFEFQNTGFAPHRDPAKLSYFSLFNADVFRAALRAFF